MAEQKTLSPVQKLNATTLSVQNQIDEYCKAGKLNIPSNYSVGNALKQFQLKVQDDEKLMACTTASLAKAMLDMCVLGLNISKTQCYCIPYANKAQLSISYLGKVAICKRIDPTISDIFGRVVKEGEEFDFEDELEGYSKILKHKRTLESLGSKNILAAYATVVYNDGKPNKSMIMTFDRIKKSWEMSRANPIDQNGNVKPGSTHGKYTEDMAIRTVIAAICKPIIATSSDMDLFGATVQSANLNEAKAEADAEASEKMGSGDVIDFDVDYTEVTPDPEHVDKETGEILPGAIDNNNQMV